jgi:DNA-binding PadR family transcriptional regulator
MSRPQLTPVSYLVLGLVEQRGGGVTAYELKQAVAGSVGYFWSFSHSSLYGEAARLAADGLLAEEQEPAGRRRRRYTMTGSGRDALQTWLREPTEVQPEVRDLGLLKLFFGGLVATEDVQALARAQEEAHRRRLARYREIAACIPEEPAWPHAAATLRMGMLVEEAFARFWGDVAERPPGAGAVVAARSTGRRGAAAGTPPA